MNQQKKDPIRQWQGRVNKSKGKQFENRLDEAFEYYKSKGYAIVEKTPEPMRPVKSLGGGRFEAFFEKKAQPDYKGTLKGGRTVLFEAKYTSSDRIDQNRVSTGQVDYLNYHSLLGARCYVVVGFDSGKVYKIPWQDFKNMKSVFGRKYAKENELKGYEVKLSWNGLLMIFD